MAKTYLVTCGTSCYSHYCKMKGKNHFVKLNELRKELEMTPEEIQADMLQSMTTSVEPVAKLSAELNTLISVGLQEADNVVLFYGNTEEAKVSAKTIEAILLKNSLCESPDLKIVNDLATAKKDLMKGLCELANKLVQKHDEYKEHSDEVIFVVTGGYKAMTAVASVVAMLKGCDTMYLFEHSDVPGNIGVLPLVINEDMIPHNVRPLLAPGKGFKHAELKSNGLSDEQITKWFSKDKETQLYMARPHCLTPVRGRAKTSFMYHRSTC
ncbi:MAG: putative CRISPR-associated protein [Planctomycetota bacterium]|nr:putative CRISPR-associated protein [Planctomycetota bacterium]